MHLRKGLDFLYPLTVDPPVARASSGRRPIGYHFGTADIGVLHFPSISLSSRSLASKRWRTLSYGKLAFGRHASPTIGMSGVLRAAGKPCGVTGAGETAAIPIGPVEKRRSRLWIHSCCCELWITTRVTWLLLS
jgi:hypothetical protein